MVCKWNASNQLESFGYCYWDIHGWFSLIICIYGVITNIINIMVLTKKSMLNSINLILTGIAVSDLVTMLSYIPFAIHFYLMNDLSVTPQRYSYGWTIFMAVHINLTLTTHTVSIWLAVIMAILRYIFVRPTSRGSKTLDNHSTFLVIIFSYIGSAVLIVPNCITTGIKETFSPTFNASLYRLNPPAIGKNDTDVMALVNFWLYPVAGKMIPIVLISIFGGLLLHTLRETDKRGRRLKGGNYGSQHKAHRRTTIMLLAVIVMYILSEVPQAILVILSACVDGFFVQVYAPLSDLIDSVALINSAVNFVMYCTMSTQFRRCLMEMIHKWLQLIREKSKVAWPNKESTEATFV
ncbi:G-protein coupled receptor dmsr-1-like [Haliotis rubra]|uniref:G-protein coupled receptor dmsr-1-like n=1 Tax=Haliotis rubra TaxID=36100 RepID=UPI001EE54A85|nr:G-protein coupled receptor dmsr-1-like [Haliotis rubra]